MGLQSQFDRLCIEMLAILTEPNIDYVSGVQKIQELAPGVPDESIKRIFTDVEKAKKREDHAIYKRLQDYEFKSKDRLKEPDEKVALLKKETSHADNRKILNSIKAAKTISSNLQHPEAKAFF